MLRGVGGGPYGTGGVSEMVVAILRCSGSLLDEILGWFACWLTTVNTSSRGLYDLRHAAQRSQPEIYQ